MIQSKKKKFKDYNREGLSIQKILQLGRLFVPKNNRAIAKVDHFSSISIKKINELLGTNYKGVILDIDDCVAYHRGKIKENNIPSIIKLIDEGMKMVIFSNMKISDRYDELIKRAKAQTGYEIKIISSKYAKPDRRGFLHCCKEMNLKPKEVVAIGDNFVTDGGANLVGIDFIKVKPYKSRIIQKFLRLAQLITRTIFNGISKLYDWIGRRKVLTDKDLLAK